MKLQPMSRLAPLVADVTSACPSVTSDAGVAPSRAFPPTWFLIRRLGQGDRAALATHVVGSPQEDRRTHLGGNSGDGAIQQHFNDLDLEETERFGPGRDCLLRGA